MNKAFELTDRFSPKEIENLRNGFDSYDQNKDGKIDKKEFRELLNLNGMSLAEEVYEFSFKVTDTNRNGVIDFEEYVALAHMGTYPQDESFKAKMVFDAFDKNRDGVIQYKELQNALMQLGVDDLDDSDIRDVLTDFDANGNGVLEFSEFFTLFQVMKEHAYGTSDSEEEDDED